MLDSGKMPEKEDNPPTLASLRARRGKPRVGKRLTAAPLASSSIFQTGLFSVPVEDAHRQFRPRAFRLLTTNHRGRPSKILFPGQRLLLRFPQSDESGVSVRL